MVVYRITQQKYSDDLSGEGARLMGGRWNPKGRPVLYTAVNSSLAMLEKLVHIRPYLLPKDLILVCIQLPKTASFRTIKKSELPLAWKMDRCIPQLNAIGSQFIDENKHLGLIVPSVVNDLDTNIVLNVKHPLFTTVKATESTAVEFDRRLL